ncbi:MAG TPA: cytochrome c maturation protein CcmE, partial [Gammaproteobacteria bacterium]|nr:cytochrome c maturation protein CcmE [Gammaproteobacteria bacterium]
MKSRTQRKLFIGLVLAGITLAGFLAYRALQENLLYFFSPSQVAAGEAPNRTFRLGGMVVEGSLKREIGTLNVTFLVTDNEHSVPVKYNRVLPDLFREGAGAVVVGRMNDKGEFIGDEVIAKHDENYMPPEV